LLNEEQAAVKAKEELERIMESDIKTMKLDLEKLKDSVRNLSSEDK